MTIIVRNTEIECDELYTGVDRVEELPSKFNLYKGTFVKTLDKDTYSFLRKVD